MILKVLLEIPRDVKTGSGLHKSRQVRKTESEELGAFCRNYILISSQLLGGHKSVNE